MKQLVGCFTVLSLVLFGSVVMAETEKASSDHDSEFYAGISVGAVFPQDLEMTDNQDPIVGLNDLDLNEGLTVGCKVGYRIGGMLKRALALELEYNHITDSDADPQHGYSASGTNVDISGELPIHSLFLNFVLRHPKGKFHPYLGFGTGWSWFKFKHIKQSADVAGFIPYGEQRNASDDKFAIQGLAGVEIDIADRVSFALGYKYYHVEPELNDPGVDLKYKAHIATTGFNYSF